MAVAMLRVGQTPAVLQTHLLAAVSMIAAYLPDAAPYRTLYERTKVFMLSAVFVCLYREPHPIVQLW